MLLSCLISLFCQVLALDTDCDDIICSNIIDYVCASIQAEDGTETITTFQNICFLKREQCLQNNVAINEIPYRYCQTENSYDSVETIAPMRNDADARRVIDYSIVGAHQTCNHTCPTFCTDAYEPACAQIWKRKGTRSTYRTMINHCHIDLYSCTAGLNVTVKPLSNCFNNALKVMFMKQVAALKSLHLLDDGNFAEETRKSGSGNKQLWDIVERIRNGS